MPWTVCILSLFNDFGALFRSLLSADDHIFFTLVYAVTSKRYNIIIIISVGCVQLYIKYVYYNYTCAQ